MSNLKDLANTPRVRGIIQKHMEALSREIAQELTRPLLEQWGLTREDLSESDTEAPSVRPEPIVPKALLYDKRSRTWICPRCIRFSNPNRRSVTTHLRFCTAEPPVKPDVPVRKRKIRRQPKKKS
jgi:hypothetical protein